MAKHKFYLTVLGIITFSVVGLLVSVCLKYLPFFLHSTIYYCQNVIRTVSVQSLPTIINNPFFMGFLITFGYIGFRLVALAVQFLKESRQFQLEVLPRGHLKKVTQELAITQQVKMIRVRRPFAVCFGVLQPKIYISSGLLKIVSANELRAILLHEKYHLDHRDNLIMLLMVVIQNLFPFFPIIKDLVAYYRIHRELEADAVAVTSNNNRHLITTLEKLILHEPQYAFVGISGLGTFDTLETRIRYLVHKTEYQPKIGIFNGVVSGVFLLMLLALSVVPVQATEFHDLGTNGIMTCVSNSECTSVCKKNVNQSLSLSPEQYSSQK